MPKLNPYNDQTKGVIHLAVTTLCNRNCPHCCNNSYAWDEVPHVTNEELNNCHTICITGGEPFSYSNPAAIAYSLKIRHKNIKTAYAYGNALEIWWYLLRGGGTDGLDGISISVKNESDEKALGELLLDRRVSSMGSNVVYDMLPTHDGLSSASPLLEDDFKGKYHAKLIRREWQEDFEADPNSILRRI